MVSEGLAYHHTPVTIVDELRHLVTAVPAYFEQSLSDAKPKRIIAIITWFFLVLISQDLRFQISRIFNQFLFLI